MNFIVHSIHTRSVVRIDEPAVLVIFGGVAEDCARGCKNGIWPIKQI